MDARVQARAEADDADDAEACELDQTLIRVSKTVADDRPDTANHREVFRRDVAATVRGCLKSSPLHGNRKEVKVVQEGCEATLADDGTWELFRNLLHGLEKTGK